MKFIFKVFQWTNGVGFYKIPPSKMNSKMNIKQYYKSNNNVTICQFGVKTTVIHFFY